MQNICQHKKISAISIFYILLYIRSFNMLQGGPAQLSCCYPSLGHVSGPIPFAKFRQLTDKKRQHAKSGQARTHTTAFCSICLQGRQKRPVNLAAQSFSKPFLHLCYQALLGSPAGRSTANPGLAAGKLGTITDTVAAGGARPCRQVEKYACPWPDTCKRVAKVKIGYQ